MTKRVIIFGAAIMTALLALAALWQFRIVIVYVAVSLALAATVRPLVKDWNGRGYAMRAVLILLYIATLGAFGYLIFLVGKFAVGDIQRLAATLATQDKWLLPIWLKGGAFELTLMARLPPPSLLFEIFTGDKGQFVLPALLGFTQGVGGVLSDILVIGFLSVYWISNQIHFERLWLSLLPAEQRKQTRDVWRIIETDIGAYIRSEAIQSLLAVLALGVGYWALGSPYPVLLALLGALAWLIPVVGAALAIIPPLLIGMLSGAQISLLTVLYTLAVLLALQIWIEPRLFTRKWDNPILTLVIALAMSDAFGLLGILVSPPLSAVCQISWSQLVARRAVPESAIQISDIQERHARVSDSVKAMDDAPALVTSSLERLAQLIEKSAPILPAELPTDPAPKI